MPNITRQQVRDVLQTLASDNKVWVAGSAAIVPELASDIDVWVTEKSTLTPEGLKTIAGASLEEVSNASYGSGIEVTAKFNYVHEGVKIQIMFVKGNIWGLLDKFDCSCHTWARDREGNIIKGKKATFPGIEPVQVNGPYDPSSPSHDRSVAFTQRYADTSKFVLWLSA